MRVLITGAAGFLGRHFARHHIYLDHEVTAVDDMSSPYAVWGFGPGLLKIDAADYLGRIGAPKYDIVYHFAAPVGGREKIEGDPLFNADSLRLDAALFRWAAIARPKVIVYPSSSAVYPLGFQTERLHVPLTERHFHPDGDTWHRPDEMYGFTKMVGEFLARKAESYGVNTLCIRPFSGYGADQSLEYPVPSIAERVMRRDDPLVIWGPGTQTRDFVHVVDVVNATLARLKSGIEGYQSMNIGWGVQTSFNDVARIMIEEVRRVTRTDYDPQIVNLPDKPFGVMHRYCDPTRMKAYYPEPKVGLQEGIAKTIVD